MDEDNQRCVAVKILNLENVRKKSVRKIHESKIVELRHFLIGKDQDAQRTQFAREGTVLSTFERVRKHSTITFDHVIRLFAS
jgi:hypothetical protein